MHLDKGFAQMTVQTRRAGRSRHRMPLVADAARVQAKRAFGRAFQLAPEHPAPPYYAGIAYVRAGDLPAARWMLARAVSLSPEGMDYRTTIANQLKVLDQFIAATEQAGR